MITESEVREVIDAMMAFYKEQPLRFEGKPQDYPLYTEPHVVNAMATMLLIEEIRDLRKAIEAKS